MAPFRPSISARRPVNNAKLVWFFPHLPEKLPYKGVKQHTDSKYEVPIYDDWFEALNSLPMGVSNVATTVPSRILNC